MDLRGKTYAIIEDGMVNQGQYSLSTRLNLNPGLYIVQLNIEGESPISKQLIIK